MKNIYFVFDETDITDKIQMVWCITVDDDEFFEKLSDAQLSSYLNPSFWELKNQYPHYTEDWHSQRSILLDEYRKLPFKAYYNIREYPIKEDNLEKIYQDNLLLLIKPLLLKYIGLYWEGNVKFCFLFEQLWSVSDSFFVELLKDQLSDSDFEVKMIWKQDYNGITSVIDYMCWSLREYLKNRENDNPNSFWKSIFELIEEKIWMVKFDYFDSEKFYHFKNKKEKFKAENHWKFANN